MAAQEIFPITGFKLGNEDLDFRPVSLEQKIQEVEVEQASAPLAVPVSVIDSEGDPDQMEIPNPTQTLPTSPPPLPESPASVVKDKKSPNQESDSPQ